MKLIKIIKSLALVAILTLTLTSCMQKDTQEAKEGNLVLVHYNGTFENGEVFDNSYDRGSPLEFTLWAGEMIPWFEAAVYGMKVWDKKSVTLSPEEAYWERDESRVEVIPRSELEWYESMWVVLEVWQTLPTMIWNLPILETTEDTITIDANSPMAWKTLNFDIELVEIK